jgi:hypothetical protein
VSVIGRLWRRAPAWRVSLVSAIALTGLAAMFPPALPTMHWPWSSPWRSASRSGPDQASFHPAPDPAPSDLGESHFMPPGIARTGFIAEAGRQVPLPDGSWQELGVAVAPGALQRAIFTRVVGNHLTGLFQVAATGALGGVASPVGVPPECSDPSRRNRDRVRWRTNAGRSCRSTCMRWRPAAPTSCCRRPCPCSAS